MSVRWITWAFQQRTNSCLGKLILVKLADNANDDGAAFPSQERLARECECTRETVSRTISKLIDQGFVSVESRQRKGRYASNIYSLHTPSEHIACSPCDGGSHGHVTEDHTDHVTEDHIEPSERTVTKEPTPKPPEGDPGLFGGEGEEKPSGPKPYPEKFLLFWEAWPTHPRKKAKAKAFEKWKGAVKRGFTPEQLFTAVQRMKRVTQEGTDAWTYLNAPEWWLSKGVFETFLDPDEWERIKAAHKREKHSAL